MQQSQLRRFTWLARTSLTYSSASFQLHLVLRNPKLVSEHHVSTWTMGCAVATADEIIPHRTSVGRNRLEPRSVPSNQLPASPHSMQHIERL